ncbi:hypothetical protein BRI9_2603 [plant metagenome]|uniref:Uncharacterized protein n=1 Tax=plant metagenome TaxID=1297885 RepID=A0A484UZT1_9ZZZZ
MRAHLARGRVGDGRTAGALSGMGLALESVNGGMSMQSRNSRLA